jgi:hypothetical protein
MQSKTCSITFATTDNQSKLLNINGDEITTKNTQEETNIKTAEYEYESDPMFGTPTTETGKLYIDHKTNLFAILTHNDRPKPETIFRKLSKEVDIDISAPTYPQEASKQFYETFGFNGYTTSFRKDLRKYTPENSSFQYIRPEEELKERAMNSRRQPGDDWLEEITNEYLENGYYVSSMDCILEQNCNQYSFTNPMSIAGIPENELSTELTQTVFERMRELHTNNVPTVNEVTTD